MKRLFAALALALAAAPAVAAPNPQLAQSVSNRLAAYGIEVPPEALTTSQAAALHLLMASEKRYLVVRQRARTILTDPDFRD
jgi:hypothetical protein